MWRALSIGLIGLSYDKANPMGMIYATMTLGLVSNRRSYRTRLVLKLCRLRTAHLHCTCVCESPCLLEVSL
jgi:hypothetical protein